MCVADSSTFLFWLTDTLLYEGIRALRTYPKRIKSLKEARQIPGVGEKTALKVGLSYNLLHTAEQKKVLNA